MNTTATTTLEWHKNEGAVSAMNEQGAEVIEISALMNRDKCMKWNEKYTPGREWFVMNEDNEIIAKGHASDLRVAKKDAVKAYEEYLATLSAPELSQGTKKVAEEIQYVIDSKKKEIGQILASGESTKEALKVIEGLSYDINQAVTLQYRITNNFPELNELIWVEEGTAMIEALDNGSTVRNAILDNTHEDSQNIVALLVEVIGAHAFNVIIREVYAPAEDAKHVVGRTGCKKCGAPNGVVGKCSGEKSYGKIEGLSTTKLRRMAGVMTTGTMIDEQKAILMKIEAELIKRAELFMSDIEQWDEVKTYNFLNKLMQGKNNSQELDAYDYERHAIALKHYTSILPVLED